MKLSSEKASRLQRFREGLNLSRTATAFLNDWLYEEFGVIDAELCIDILQTETDPVCEALLRLLDVEQPADLAYRRVVISHDSVALSEAQNWYVPKRLTVEMRRAIARTRQPFGHIVGPIVAHRDELPRMTQASIPDSPKPRCKAPILECSALLRRSDDKPISLVREWYTSAIVEGTSAHRPCRLGSDESPSLGPD